MKRFSYVFWMGDLNFRLLEELEMSLEEIVARVKKGEYQKLFEYDQLRYVMRKGDAFTELQEGDITFPPTFKFEVESSFYDCKYGINILHVFISAITNIFQAKTCMD